MQVILKRYEITISDVIAENEQMALHRITTPDDMMQYEVIEIEPESRLLGWLSRHGWKTTTALLIMYILWLHN